MPHDVKGTLFSFNPKNEINRQHAWISKNTVYSFLTLARKNTNADEYLQQSQNHKPVFFLISVQTWIFPHSFMFATTKPCS